ncbi:hypothetical protein CVIRNUC_009821 [Coccomyxa viridis]|uniref:Asl1-like glycosyl hydrolase catalytic domain-containing protein n=1 Tax=Coccomyxa viridis TaxID=1274662 RepID=A0AAV1IIV5_9CHLO|nr:hypothetical protein CVIRNUC_009821 [Coccomyxa viridis]
MKAIGAIPIVLLALLRCSALARAQTPNCAAETELTLLYKVFAQNENAFNTFLDLLPAPTEARVKSLYLSWLDNNKNQTISYEIKSPKLEAVAQAQPFAAVLQSCANTSTTTPSTTTSAPPTTTSAPPSTTSAAPTSTKSVATTPGPPTTLSAQFNPKKGASMVYFSNVNTALKDARLSWTYNWWYSMHSGTTLPSGTQFVPMIYAASDATTANLNTAKSYKTGIVLGFNEPNEANQADNTVAQAIAAWPTLMASGLRLGSPALSASENGTDPNSWIGQFMQQINQKAYHVDFMTVHWYGNLSYFGDPTAATASLQAYLQGYYNSYQRNVWLTEWCLADFGNATNNYAFTFATYNQQVAFLQQAVPMLNSLSFVERYAWYFLSPDQTYDGQNGLPLDTASLYTSSGSETPTGAAYRPN